MSSHYEVSLHQDLERIREKVAAMGRLCERALRDAVRALLEGNRQLAYSVIIRDQRIDEFEKELDQLCLDFLVRQQPAGAPLRLVYATIRINQELEAVGDYAESIARQVIKLTRGDTRVPTGLFTELAERSIQTLTEAVHAYMKQDAGLARDIAQLEELVDALKSRVNADLVQLFRDNQIPLEGLHPLMTIARRLERVSDQARNIGIEVLYFCTGQDAKHPGSDVYRILFVDAHDACRSLMAVAAGQALQQPGFVFESAGITPRLPESSFLEFMREKGFDSSRAVPKGLSQVPHLDEQNVVIALAAEVTQLIPQMPPKAVFLDWGISIPVVAPANPESTRAAYEQTYQSIHDHLKELVDAIIDNKHS